MHYLKLVKVMLVNSVEFPMIRWLPRLNFYICVHLCLSVASRFPPPARLLDAAFDLVLGRLAKEIKRPAATRERTQDAKNDDERVHPKLCFSLSFCAA